MGYVTEILGTNTSPVYYHYWSPAVERGTLVIIHGYGEHGGRYANVAQAVTPAGIGVYAFDLRGHGQSRGLRTHVDSFADYLVDTHNFLREVVCPNNNGPLFLLGHSMGSIVAVNFLLAYNVGFCGLILSGTGYASSLDKPHLRLVSRICSRLIPKGRIKFPLPPEFISSDPGVVQAYKEDPLVYGDLTFRLAHEMSKYLHKARSGLGRITLPVLVQVGSWDSCFTQVDLFMSKLGSEDKTLKVYPGSRHEVYNELPEKRNAVLQDLRGWLGRHLNPKKETGEVSR